MELPEADGHFSMEDRSEDAAHGHPLLLAGATPAQAPVGSGRRHSLGNDLEPVRLRRPSKTCPVAGARSEAVTRKRIDFLFDGLANGHAVANDYPLVAVGRPEVASRAETRLLSLGRQALCTHIRIPLGLSFVRLFLFYSFVVHGRHFCIFSDSATRSATPCDRHGSSSQVEILYIDCLFSTGTGMQ